MQRQIDGLIVDDAPTLTAAEREAIARTHKVIDLAEVRRERERAAFLRRYTRPMGDAA